MRNKLFDWEIFNETEFGVPVITVGNLAVGGTGKTPLVEHIIRALGGEYRIAVLSRGYRRRTRGFVLAGKKTGPADIGDESYQIYHKFGRSVTVAVCENRVNGIKKLLEHDKKIQLIVLDDGFQHRYVRPTLSILVSEYSRPIYNDTVLPYGRLRESAMGVNRADIVLVTKCPSGLKPMEYRTVSNGYNLQPWQQLFFSHIKYQPLRPVFGDVAQSVPYLDWLTENDSILAIAGIGNPRPFVKHLKHYSARVKVDIYPDHHRYTADDIRHFLERYRSLKGNRRIIITTEKDAVRLADNPDFPQELKAVTYYLPLEIEFDYPFDATPFDAALRKTLLQRIREQEQNRKKK